MIDLLLIPLFIGIVSLFLIFWIWVIVDVVKRDFENDNEKIIWLLLIILLGIIPSIVYYFVVIKPNNDGIIKKKTRAK